MRIVAVTIVGLLLATAYPAIAQPINSPPVDLTPTLRRPSRRSPNARRMRRIVSGSRDPPSRREIAFARPALATTGSSSG